MKKEFPDLGLVGDVALDPYTDHGHDGVIRDGYVANDETLAILAEQALVQAEAGIDIIAPSDMMDGRVAADPAVARRRRSHPYPHHELCRQICERLLRSLP